MNYNKSLLFITLFLPFLFLSCSTHNRIDKFNSASTYVDEFSGSFLQNQVFHQNDTISEMSVKIDASKITGLKKNQLEVYSFMTFKYEVYTSLNKKDLVQSDTYKLSELIPFNNINNGGVIINIPLKLKQDNHYIVLLSVQDQVNKKNYFKLLRVSKNIDSPENFRITNEKDELIWYSWINSDQTIKIKYRYKNNDKLFLSYYKPKFSPAKPPYAKITSGTNEFETANVFDSFEVQLDNGQSNVIQLPYDGAFIVHPQENKLKGKLITKFYNGYPELGSDAQRVFSLRYLNSKKEFFQMMQDTPEHTIQEFWVFEGRSKERSAQMMNTYYNRVKRANELFTSYKEGWKTDRGMIFLIYGPPDNIFNEADREVWEYGSEASYNDLRFEFVISDTKLNNQEYVLLRSNDYKTPWYTILENWRNE